MMNTPRTDALLRERGECRDSAFLNFARDLEREIATAKAALEIIANECMDCQRIARESLAKIK